jgi:hypothetical protein
MTHEERMIAALKAALGYVEGNHDEGCELHPEYGESEFERNNLPKDEDDDYEDRDWPDDAKCTCGTDEMVNSIKELIAE